MSQIPRWRQSSDKDKLSLCHHKHLRLADLTVDSLYLQEAFPDCPGEFIGLSWPLCHLIPMLSSSKVTDPSLQIFLKDEKCISFISI